MNFPQYDYYAYCPNKPMFTRKLLPASSREDFFETINLLTLPSEDTIDKLDDCFAEIGKKSYEAFQAEIDDISDDIEKGNSKNKRRGNAVYSYLNPAVVPASIDI